MNWNRVLSVIVLCCASLACLGQQPPLALLHAAQCLSAKGFLPRLKTTAPSFGFITDTNSYPGDTVLYVVEFGSRSSEGWVFAVFQRTTRGREVFDVQNNARFVLTKTGNEGIDFVDPPLGGEWTQQQLIDAIKRIEKQPRFKIALKDLRSASAEMQCRWYTDAQ